MSTSNQTYKELAIPYFRDVFDIIDRVMRDNAVPYYLIGATAIALEFLKEGKKPSRGTKDIDFALMVSTMSEYDRIIDGLVSEGFNKVKLPWTIYHPEFDVAVDLLPFGQIEENDTDSFNERYSDLHVLGFKEVLENPDQVAVEDKVAKIPPLAGMVVLKLVAWSDRPEERDNDLSDILKIIDAYCDHDWDNVVDNHHDLFEIHDITGIGEMKIGSRILGRLAKEYMTKSEALSKRIFGLLQEHLANPDASEIARNWARAKDINLEEAASILKEFETGLKE